MFNLSNDVKKVLVNYFWIILDGFVSLVAVSSVDYFSNLGDDQPFFIVVLTLIIIPLSKVAKSRYDRWRLL
jgi:hypothetical protein